MTIIAHPNSLMISQDWLVHIKDAETGEHIIEPVIASAVEVAYDFSGPLTGQLSMEFDSSVSDDFEWFWHNHQEIPQVNIQVNPVHNDVNENNYSRCVLSSMNFGGYDDNVTINMTWVFMGNPYSESAIARAKGEPEPETKLNWLQEGF